MIGAGTWNVGLLELLTNRTKVRRSHGHEYGHAVEAHAALGCGEDLTNNGPHLLVGVGGGKHVRRHRKVGSDRIDRLAADELGLAPTCVVDLDIAGERQDHSSREMLRNRLQELEGGQSLAKRARQHDGLIDRRLG